MLIHVDGGSVVVVVLVVVVVEENRLSLELQRGLRERECIVSYMDLYKLDLFDYGRAVLARHRSRLGQHHDQIRWRLLVSLPEAERYGVSQLVEDYSGSCA